MGDTLTIPQVGELIEGSISLPADCLADFNRAIKIGYYKMMKEKGLISDSQFEILMLMQAEKKAV